MNKKGRTGIEGERIAVDHIKSKGYKILHCNWRFRRLEIDIIARDGTSLVFVEVKTRSTNSHGNPEHFVDKSKERFMAQAAEAYLERFREPIELRFDIISIRVSSEEESPEIEHFKDAFYPIGN